MGIRKAKTFRIEVTAEELSLMKSVVSELIVQYEHITDFHRTKMGDVSDLEKRLDDMCDLYKTLNDKVGLGGDSRRRMYDN